MMFKSLRNFIGALDFDESIRSYINLGLWQIKT